MLKVIPKSCSQFQPPWDLGSGVTNNSDLLCLQAENISDLEFKGGLNCTQYSVDVAQPIRELEVVDKQASQNAYKL